MVRGGIAKSDGRRYEITAPLLHQQLHTPEETESESQDSQDDGTARPAAWCHKLGMKLVALRAGETGDRFMPHYLKLPCSLRLVR
jgi:hypothetical protein